VAPTLYVPIPGFSSKSRFHLIHPAPTAVDKCKIARTAVKPGEEA
jgi:hypothetical protein